jgi:intracellular multiplication protein IcmJ
MRTPMTLRSISLQAEESNWRLFMLRKADPGFLAFAEKVVQRDEHTCQFCGFQAKQHQEIINLDQNYTNNKMNNLVTACVFCSQCFFLESIGKNDIGGGTLIYLEDMSQGELNALCHVLFAAIIAGTSYSANAKNIYRSLRLRSQVVEKHLGDGFSNPALLGQMMIDANVENVDALHQQIAPKIRVLPNIAKYANLINDWAEAGLKELSA